MFLSLNSEQVTLILLGICMLPIAAVIVFAFIKVVKFAKKKPSFNEDELNEELILQREVFYKAYGGEENVLEVNCEMSRITVTVSNIEDVDTEKLKELGATGVLLVGNQVKCGFGDRAHNIYNIMK